MFFFNITPYQDTNNDSYYMQSIPFDAIFSLRITL